MSLACICEKVLREEDGVLSAIRIVDTFRVHAGAAAAGAPVRATALVGLKSASVRGKREVRLVLTPPNGAPVTVHGPTPVLFAGDEQGNNIVLEMSLPAQALGLYNLAVYCDGELLTTVPFRLLEAPA